MKFKLLAIASLVLIFSKTLYSQKFETYQDLYQAFTTMEADPNAIIHVNSMMLQKDIGTFSLDSGKIYFLKPVGGRVMGAVFLGTGTFSFEPPIYSEKTQIRRFYKKMAFTRSFTSLGMIFGDDTYNQLKSEYPFSGGIIDPKVNEVISSIYQYTCSKKYNLVGEDFGFTFLNNQKNSLFSAVIKDTEGANMWSVSPYDQEEITFDKGEYSAGYGDYMQNVCKFPNERYFSDSLQRKKESNTYIINDYDMNCNIVSNSIMNSIAKMNITIKDSNIKWISFVVDGNFKIDSVRLSNGTKLSFYAPQETGSVWVCLDKKYNLNEKLNIELAYSGTFLRKYENYTLLSSSTGWYPRNPYNYKELANFKTRFLTSKFLKFISVGTKILDSVYDDIRICDYKIDHPVRNVSFMVGPFDLKQIKTNDLPPINLYYIDSEQHKAVLSDLENSFRFYQNFFGKIRVNEFNATELAGGHGEAFPGMLHLSYYAFVSGSKTGQWEQFVSHEVAHQWWGIEVDFESYRDQWLSEAFSEYSSMMYTQAALKDNDKFFDLLSESKKNVLVVKEGKSSFSGFRDGTERGVISLGYRNGMDYQTVVYSKGAWVLHMLRNLFLDFSKMNDDKFLNMLKEFFTTFHGKNATTEAFKSLVEKNVGKDMTWFFNQWIDDNQIPKYTFGYKTEMTPEGKCKVKCKIKQEKTDENLFMVVPIKIDFGENRFYPMRINITGKMTEIELPLLPMKPKNIQFNTLESVLCEYETEDYDDIK